MSIGFHRCDISSDLVIISPITSYAHVCAHKTTTNRAVSYGLRDGTRLKSGMVARRLFHLAICCCLLAIVSGSFAKPLHRRGGKDDAIPEELQQTALHLNVDQDGYSNGDLADSNRFWAESLESWSAVRPLFSEEDRKTLAKKMRKLKVVSLEPGCGRMKNRLATLEDGTRVCCRYRESGNQLRGDLYAYHFNRILGMWNVPATVAVKLDLTGKQWRNVTQAAEEAGWKNGVSIIASQVVDDLQDEYFPPELLNTSAALPLTLSSAHSIERLMQWTDMILFDYIIGHNDRLFNALLNSKWNSHMMEKPVHNLKKTAKTADLVLLDNESGFEFGYIAAEKKEEYHQLQINFLDRICVFRRPTISSLMTLGSSAYNDRGSLSPSAHLENYIREVDLQSFTAVRKWKTQYQAEFDARVRRTLERVHKCALLVNR